MHVNFVRIMSGNYSTCFLANNMQSTGEKPADTAVEVVNHGGCTSTRLGPGQQHLSINPAAYQAKD